jgi:flagellar basal body P-ring formation protein FlgA
MKYKTPIALWVIFAANAAHSQAISFEDIAGLDRQVATIANAQPIDTRLKLAQCPQKIIIAPPVGGAVTVRCNALGWRILVPVIQNTTSSASQELRVHKGDTVEMVIDSEGFEVSSPAIIMQDGATGDDVRVKTMTGAVILTAKVTSRGTVRVYD